MKMSQQASSLVADPGRFTMADFAELTRLRLTSLILVTAAVGFLLFPGHAGMGVRLLSVLIGLGFVSAGATAFNQVIERDTDARMSRTQNRPLPRGRIAPQAALGLGTIFCALGLVILMTKAGLPTAILAAASAAIYIAAYTPLKRRSSLNTLVGAVSGALPPVIGWVGAGGRLDGGATVLFGILFVWQLIHLFAIAWIYRDDYANAGLVMVSGTDDAAGTLTMRLILLASLTMIPISLLPSLIGQAGLPYAVAALVLGLGFCATAIHLAVRRSRVAARRLFLASIAYLPILLFVLVIDHVS